jgi:hypothetical protein
MKKALLICLTLFQYGFCQSFLHTSSDKIVDGNGDEIILEGVGLGGWLLMEGYMLHTSGFANAQWDIKEHVQDLIGPANAETFYQYYHDNYVQKADIDKIAEWGFNSIRLPFHYNILTPEGSPGVYLEEGFAVLDSVISWCEANQIYLILDMHAAPGGQSDEPISDYNPANPSLWEDPANQDRTVDIWRKIAERYHDEEWIGGYDLINEPKWELGPNNQPLRDLYVRITDTIRVVDNNHIIFIEGNWFATAFNGLTPPWDDNMVYSFHKYWNSNDQGAIQYLVNIRNDYDVPLWLGETGENSNAWFVDCVELMQANNIGWAWWPHKKIDAIAGPLSAQLLPNYQVLLDYWNGQGGQPTVTFATNALIQQAQALSITQTDFHSGVIDALIRQPGNTNIIPFINNQIPGVIYGAHYDLGKRGFAYEDSDYHNVGGGSWNNGWTYRNDGVDIEKCNDAFTLGYNVGWIEHGEWLKHTVVVQQSGTFNLNLRVSSPNSGGKILVKWDGSNLTDIIDLPATGGWQNWETVSVSNIQLTSGTHSLQIRFLGGGFNYNYIEFVQTAVNVEDEEQPVKDFKVMQNYPNPFNPNTNIEYIVPSRGRVVLKLYDTLGNEIALLQDVELDEGKYSYNLNSKNFNLSSGIYFYQVVFEGKRSFTRKAVLLK